MASSSEKVQVDPRETCGRLLPEYQQAQMMQKQKKKLLVGLLMALIRARN
jgi:hypothetical protein